MRSSKDHLYKAMRNEENAHRGKSSEAQAASAFRKALQDKIYDLGKRIRDAYDEDRKTDVQEIAKANYSLRLLLVDLVLEFEPHNQDSLWSTNAEETLRKCLTRLQNREQGMMDRLSVVLGYMPTNLFKGVEDACNALVKHQKQSELVPQAAAAMSTAIKPVTALVNSNEGANDVVLAQQGVVDAQKEAAELRKQVKELKSELEASDTTVAMLMSLLTLSTAAVTTPINASLDRLEVQLEETNAQLVKLAPVQPSPAPTPRPGLPPKVKAVSHAKSVSKAKTKEEYKKDLLDMFNA